MRLDDYFTFSSPNAIQIKGTNVGIESILYDYLYRGQRPEEIGASHPTILLEHVFATITFYFHNQEAIRAYLDLTLEREKARRERLQPPKDVNRFRRVRARRAAEQRMPALSLAS